MMTPRDEFFLRRALRIAMNGRGRVEPNPMVGCVIVNNDQVIGEGFHAHFGGAHAEPNALADVAHRGNSPRGATAYVTLEPCCHLNKKTPPCVPRLIEAGIARVAIGCVDPNADVNGKGIAMLRDAGVAVDIAADPLAAEFRQLIAPFIRSTQSPLPYITLKWAESANGLVGGPNRTPVRISGPAATRAVHELRTRSHGIGVGIGTVLSDQPALTARGVAIINQPARYIFDRRLRMPVTSKMLRHHETPIYVLCGPAAATAHPERVKALRKMFATVDPIEVPDDNSQAVLQAASFAGLCGKHLLIEPGPTIAKSFLSWADRLWVFRSNSELAAHQSAPRAASIPDYYLATGSIKLADDTLTEYFNIKSEAFFAPTPSADFMLLCDSIRVS